jgi:hypothetical protein
LVSNTVSTPRMKGQNHKSVLSANFANDANCRKKIKTEDGDSKNRIGINILTGTEPSAS